MQKVENKKISAGEAGADVEKQQKTEEVFHISRAPRLVPLEGNDH